MNTPPDGAEPYEQFVDEDDFQLMEWLGAFGDDDPATARQAWAVLYNRHAPFLLAVVRRTAHDAFGDAAAAEDVVTETFKKVYEKAGTFNPPTEPMDGDAKRRWFRAWLSRIGNNLIRDVQRTQQQFHARHVDQDHWSDIEDMVPVASSDAAWISRVMDEVLDDREQDKQRTEPKKPGEKVSTKALAGHRAAEFRDAAAPQMRVERLVVGPCDADCSQDCNEKRCARFWSSCRC